MAHRVIDNADDMADFLSFFRGLSPPLTVSWTAGRDRSLDQNRLQWLWANEAAEQFGDRSADQVQRTWKLHYGVPILRADDEEFRAAYDMTIRPLPYHAKLLAMRFVEVTSAMKVKQMVRYLDAVEEDCAAHGIHLTPPDAGLAKYQARYRSDA